MISGQLAKTFIKLKENSRKILPNVELVIRERSFRKTFCQQKKLWVLIKTRLGFLILLEQKKIFFETRDVLFCIHDF